MINIGLDTEEYKEPDYHWVEILANNSCLKSNNTGVPEPSVPLMMWFAANNIEDVQISMFRLITKNGLGSHFVVDVGFSGANHALLFKLTWGGV